MRVIKCDKCGKTISKPLKLQIKGEQTDPVLMMAQSAELCQKCYESIYDLMDDFFTYKERA